MANVNWRNQLALALGLFVLGMAAYWLEFRHKPAKESEEEQTKKLFQLKDTAVERMRIFSGGKSIELKCSDPALKLCKPGDNAKWELTAPLKSSADDAGVNSLVSTLNNLNSTESISLSEETPEKRQALLKEYGLDPATLDTAAVRSISVETPKEKITLFLGMTHPISDGFFALRAVQKSGTTEPASKAADQKQVFLVPTYFKSNFERDLTYWRDKKLLTLPSNDVAAFVLESQKAGKLTATREGTQWQLQVGGQNYPGDIENIDSFVGAATSLAAKAFVSDDKNSPPAKNALKGTRRILFLELSKKKPEGDKPAEPAIVLSMFRKPKGEKLLATVSNLDPLFELEPAAFNRLDKELKDFRLAKLVSSLERFTAKRLEFAGLPIGPQPLVLTQPDGKWKADGLTRELDSEKVQQFLDRITGNRIKGFLAGAAIPKGEKDGIRVTLGDDKTEAKRQFVYWKANGNLYARDLLSSRKDEAFLLDSALLQELPWSRAFFEKVAPVAAPSAAPVK